MTSLQQQPHVPSGSSITSPLTHLPLSFPYKGEQIGRKNWEDVSDLVKFAMLIACLSGDLLSRQFESELRREAWVEIQDTTRNVTLEHLPPGSSSAQR